MSNSQKIDLTGFSDSDINSLYRDAQRGVRRQGYDDSNDVTVDYDPLPQDAINAAKAVTSDWKGGKWDAVRDEVKHGYSEEDLIHKMRGAVSNEYLTRMEGRVDANTNREFPKPEAPKAEAKEEPEEPGKPRPKVEVDLESIKPFEPQIDGQQGASYMGQKPAGDPVKAKEKAQAFKASSKPDYSFNAGSYGSKPAATASADYGSSEVSGADAYGNVPASTMNAEHEAEQLKNTHLTKAKEALGSL